MAFSELPSADDSAPARLSFSDIQTSIGGTNPISLSEYYRGTTLVTDSDGIALDLPQNGTISFSDMKFGFSRDVTYTSPGTHTIQVPDDNRIDNISFVIIGASGTSGVFQYKTSNFGEFGGNETSNMISSNTSPQTQAQAPADGVGGAALVYVNDLPVSPGDVITVNVGTKATDPSAIGFGYTFGGQPGGSTTLSINGTVMATAEGGQPVFVPTSNPTTASPTTTNTGDIKKIRGLQTASYNYSAYVLHPVANLSTGDIYGYTDDPSSGGTLGASNGQSTTMSYQYPVNRSAASGSVHSDVTSNAASSHIGRGSTASQATIASAYNYKPNTSFPHHNRYWTRNNQTGLSGFANVNLGYTLGLKSNSGNYLNVGPQSSGGTIQKHLITDEFRNSVSNAIGEGQHLYGTTSGVESSLTSSTFGAGLRGAESVEAHNTEIPDGSDGAVRILFHRPGKYAFPSNVPPPIARLRYSGTTPFVERSVTLTPSSNTANEGDTIVINITFLGDWGKYETVSWSTSGNVTSGDLTGALSGTLDKTISSLSFPVVLDGLTENYETFTLTTASISSYGKAVTAGSTTVTIQPNST